MVGFPDFIYKHIVPACFLAPLKPTFDLADAQTVLVSSWRRHTRAEGAALRDALACLADAVGVCRHAEDDSSEEGKRRRWWAGGASRLLLIPLSLCSRAQSSSTSCSRSTYPRCRCLQTSPR